MELRIQNVFREVLEDEDFVLDRTLKREDLEAWDSLTHIQLVLGLEKEFGIKFSTQQIMKMQSVEDIFTFLESR
ncbi:MAG: acyl carrier protein [Lachnospiraceae bacterium]|nr:acyl carrier protein [Lachnospiraceae bacterium]